MNKQEIIRKFRLHKDDRFSLGIEIGFLSERIQVLEDFLVKLNDDHPYFFTYRLKLIKLVNLRRKMLNLLLSTNTPLHNTILNKLRNSYKKWGTFLENDHRFLETVDYYQSIPQLPPVFQIQSNGLIDSNIQESFIEFDKNITQFFLTKSQQAFNTQANDLLLAVLVLAIGDCTGHYQLLLSLEGHGRESFEKDFDLTRTIGWFTTMYPVYLSITQPENIGKVIQDIKENLRKVPEKGLGYGIAAGKNRIHVDEPQILFNYLGQWDNSKDNRLLFKFGNHSVGNTVGDNKPSHLLEINGYIKNKQLQFFWTYNGQLKDEIVSRIIKSFSNHFIQLVNYTVEQERICYSPSDFPLISISQSQLDRINIEKKGDLIPVSPIQEGMIFESILQSAQEAYFVQTIFELKGIFDEEKWIESWNFLINRYDSLRASFVWEGLSAPLQHIHPKVKGHWENTKSSNPDDPIPEVLSIAEKERKKGFNLAKPPLMRFNLIHVDNQKHYFIWNQHPILTDGWCMPLIIQEILQVYYSLIEGKVPRLKDRRFYKDYIQYLHQKDHQSAELYWKNLLNRVLPTKLGGNEVSEDGEHYLELTEKESQKLINISRDLHVTPNSLFQAAWGTLISIQSRQREVIFGVTISGRQIDLTGVEDIIGIFINTIPLRINVDPYLSFETLCNQVQKQMSQSQEEGFLPLGTIQAKQNLGHEGLFDNIFVYENYPSGQSKDEKQSLSLTPIAGKEKTEYSLTVTVIPSKSTKIKFSYSGKAFNHSSIKTISLGYEKILRSILNNPKRSIGSIGLEDNITPNFIKCIDQEKEAVSSKEGVYEIFEKGVSEYPDRLR